MISLGDVVKNTHANFLEEGSWRGHEVFSMTDRDIFGLQLQPSLYLSPLWLASFRRSQANACRSRIPADPRRKRKP